MEQYFTLGEEIISPSSWWDDNMVMLKDEPNLPFELMLYVSWFPFHEKHNGGFVWFRPNQVFRLPNETSYILAQNTKECIGWSSSGSGSGSGWYRTDLPYSSLAVPISIPIPFHSS